jgi:2,4-dienoyl-CoA reductase (NADPH2)
VSTDSKYRKLFEPGQIGKLKIKNRLVRSAAGTDYLDENFFSKSELQLPFYKALARGGAGLIILGGAVIEHPLGSVTPTNVRFDDDKFIPGFKEITDIVHKYDCPIFLQLHHSGAWRGVYNMITGESIQPVSSSGQSREELRAVGMDFGLPLRELTIPEIKNMVKLFVDAAVRGRKAGFDGIELNVATCHLGNSFLSRAWNRRQDEYGASTLENRTRFVVEILQETRRQLGNDVPVGVLINGGEFGIKDGLTPAESQDIARVMEKAGADFIHVRGYGYGDYWDLHVPDSIFFPDPPSPLAYPLDGSHYGAGISAPLAAEIKKAVSIPVIAVGRLDIQLGEEMLEQGKADFIAMQRRLIADPELPNKTAQGRPEDIAPCTACFGCFAQMQHGKPVRCRINAAIGGSRDYVIDKATQPKRVLVVGAGPTGMEAARVAALRGHRVTLFEKEGKLGGLMPLASIMKKPALEDLESIVTYFKTQLKKLGVDVRLGTEFKPSHIDELKPDVIILAVGGVPAIPDIPGIQNIKVTGMPGLHAMMKRYLKFISPNLIRPLSRIWMPIGKEIVILGGRIQGLELAEFLTRSGRKVTIMDESETLDDERWSSMQNMRLMNWFKTKGVTTMTGVKYNSITDASVNITTKEGQTQAIRADTIIPVVPLLPNKELLDEVQGKAKEIYSIGDCSEPGIIMDAVAAGYDVARRI